MPSEPVWLETDEVLELNALVVTATGEPFGLREGGLLISALQRPRNHWHYNGEDDAVSLAVTLLFALASNHPFVQGNKRTAFEAALIFLANNGYEFIGPDHPTLADAIIAVIDGSFARADFEEVFRRYVIPADEEEIPPSGDDPP